MYSTLVFFVTDPWFLAGAAATFAFFTAFSVLIKLFFCMSRSSSFKLARLRC
jgi:hypothetical protein